MFNQILSIFLWMTGYCSLWSDGPVYANQAVTPMIFISFLVFFYWIFFEWMKNETFDCENFFRDQIN